LAFVVMAGFVGQVTLAELTFAGIAAFGVARLSGVDHLGFPWSPLLAIGLTTVAATILSFPAVRVRGLHLVIVTYSGAIALQEVVMRNPKLTGVGNMVTTPMPSLFGWEFGSASGPKKPGTLPYKPFGFLVLLVTVACTLMVVNLRRSSLGRRMLAVRANERAAASVGVRVSRTKLLGAAIGSFVAACAGVLWAYKFISFNNAVFPASDSLIYIGAVFIGGISMVSGAYIAGIMASGGVLLELIGHGQGPARWQLLVSGAGMVLVTIRFPGGIASLGPWARRRWDQRQQTLASSTQA
jgi:branched-chain amino acid transport system permease protein